MVRRESLTLFNQWVTNGMVRRLNLSGGIRGDQEASHEDSYDWYRSG